MSEEIKKTTSPYITVRSSSIHNKGIFAKTDIPEGTQILEYVGEKITKKQSDDRYDSQLEKHKKNSAADGAVYIFELNKRYDIDGNVSWNTAKYINHSCSPNCDPEIIRGQIWIVALRDIKKGEELSYNYGYDLEDWTEHPCRCSAKNCVGYIASEDLWPKLKKKIAAEKRKKAKTKKKK